MGMISLDEAIQHCEKVAEEQAELYECHMQHGEQGDYINECLKCAAEHRQLAEWLKDYKRLLEQEPCEDAISRDAVDELSKALVHTTRDKADFICNFWEELKKLPPVTLQQKVGWWISFGTQGEIDDQILQAFTCSECGAISIFRMSNGNIVNGDLCPNCGAKMVGSQESEG